eukprot:88639_1
MHVHRRLMDLTYAGLLSRSQLSFATAFIAYLLYRFIKETSADVKNKCMSKLSIILFVTITLSLCFTAFAFLTCCIDNLTIKPIFAQLGMVTLFGLLFYRLDLVFKNTVYEISRALRILFHHWKHCGVQFFYRVMHFITKLIGPFIYKLWIITKRLGHRDNADLRQCMIKTFY